jgi:hypothetical protein
MWKPEQRLVADRSGLRYPSDLTDTEWAIVEPMIPPARHGGRKRSVSVREVLNGIFYVVVHPAFRTVMEHSIFCAGRADCSRSSSAFSPMADMPETRWRSSCGAPGHGSWKS